ncbi:MAG TPA: hypothetical protein P5218_16655, partial [Planctomycetota bacterium]|nr:hypothetical protein [Planctomycetota bacterium]
LRIVVNTGRWWKTDISADDPGVVALDVGAYNPVLGTSYTEIAARSRTNHKSQGFGSTGSRGEELEFFEHLAGSQAEHSLFDGVRSDWSRIPGGEAIGAKIQAVRANFDAAHPEASLPGLVGVHRARGGCSDRYWKARKRFEVEGLIRACAGLYLEAAADRPLAAPGEEVAVQLELVARNASDCHLVGIDCAALGWALVEDTALERNRKLVLNRSFQAPAAVESDGPYWLQETGTLGTYRVDDPALLGRPQNPPTLEWILHLVVAGEALAFPIPVIYKWNDPVQGERYRPFDVVPPVFVAFGESSYLFPGTETRSVDVVVKGLAAETAGTLQLTAGESWTLEPASIELGSLAPGEEQHFSVRVTPGSGAKPCELQAQVQVD